MNPPPAFTNRIKCHCKPRQFHACEMPKPPPEPRDFGSRDFAREARPLRTLSLVTALFGGLSTGRR